MSSLRNENAVEIENSSKSCHKLSGEAVEFHPRNEFQQQRQDVQVQLQYLKNDQLYETQKPIQITPNFLDLEGRTNVRLAPGDLETIHDVRGNEDKFTLDSNGFRYVLSPSTFTEWSSQPEIGRIYLPQLEALLRQEVDGCDEILFYDARIRQKGDEGLRVEGLSYNPFARQVHTDNTERSVIAKIRNLTEMKADYLLRGRARIINIWRPIKHPVYDCGLAIADGGKLREDDVLECDRHRQDTGEYWDTMGVIKYRPGFEWWYMSQQSPDEVLLFKNYDSATDVAARCCLHTAFDLPSDMIPAGTPTRESIEVRALIFTYPTDGPRPTGGLNIQHPLAETLERSQLNRMDIGTCFVPSVRFDIDEGGEIKDAELLLRKREARKLEEYAVGLEGERDILRKQLLAANQQIEMMARNTEMLQEHLDSFSRQLENDCSGLIKSMRDLSAGLVDARLGLHEHARSEPLVAQTCSGNLDDDQRLLWEEELKKAREDAEKWKAEALRTHGSGNRAVSVVWQGSVDEAVRREREKDAVVIKGLLAEIDRLKGGPYDLHAPTT